MTKSALATDKALFVIQENTDYSNESRQWKLINFRLAGRRLTAISASRDWPL
jgi:hypothetical protein